MCSDCGCRAAEEIDPVESVIVPAPMGRGVAQYYAEGGETATYVPSQEPEGSTPATEPTNANFSAEHEYWCSYCGDNEKSSSPRSCRNQRNGGHHSDMCGTCYETHDGMCYYCESGDEYGAESKSMFSKDKNGKMYARRRNGRIITHNAEHEGVYACSKCKHWNRNPVDGITKCKKCGNGTFTFVKKSEFMPDGDGNVVGQQTFGFNGTPLHAEEDTSFGLVGEGNDFGQMRAEGEYSATMCESCEAIYPEDDEGDVCECGGTIRNLYEYEDGSADFEADFSIEKPFQTGVKLSAGLLTGAALFGLAGATLTALIGSMMDKGE